MRNLARSLGLPYFHSFGKLLIVIYSTLVYFHEVFKIRSINNLFKYVLILLRKLSML